MKKVTKKITATQKLSFVLVVAAIGAYLVSKSFASDIFHPNQLALLQDDTTKPYNVERVKTAFGYQIKTTSQPIALIATTQGDVYCAGSDNELHKVSVGRKTVKDAVTSAAAEITTTKTTEADTISGNNIGEATLAYDGKKTNSITIKNTAYGQRYKRAIKNLKNTCLATGKKVVATDLPEFSLPPAEKTNPISSWLYNHLPAQTAHAATNTNDVVDTIAEGQQHSSIKNARYTNNPRLPAYYRVSCIDQISRNWSHWMAAQGKLYHNVNFVTQIEKNCGLANKWSQMGENVGYGPDSDAVFSAFMASPGHRANILNKNFDRLGIGVWKMAPRIYVTQNFVNMASGN